MFDAFYRRKRTRAAQAKARRTRLAVERLGENRARALRFEQVEPRLLLAHMAPEVNPAVIAHFNAVQENEPIGSNTGETVSALLASGGIIITQQSEAPIPEGDNSEFAFFDQSYGGQEGIAVTGISGAAEGAWQYSRDGKNWTSIPGSVSPANALLLSGELPGTTSENDLLRYLPNPGFSGSIALQFACWDQTDLKTPGTAVNLNTTGTGGSTPYSTALGDGLLQITPNTPPSFNIVSTADTVLENNTDGNSNGGDSGTLTAENVVSDILPGNGGGNAVSFSASDPYGHILNPSVAGDGSLSFHLAENCFGPVTLNVTATNGTLSTTKTTQVMILQTTPPSFGGSNKQLPEEQTPTSASYPNWATAVNYGDNGSAGPLSYTITSDSNTGLFTSGPAISSSGTLTFTPAANAVGQATITAVLHNSETNLDSSPVTFTIGIYGQPTATAKSYVVNYSTGGSPSGTATGVLAGVTDPNSAFDGGVTAHLTSGASFGIFSLNAADGTFSFVPDSSFKGLTRFTYEAVSGPAYSVAEPATIYSGGGALVAKMYQQMLSRAAQDSDVEYWAPSVDSSANFSYIATVDQALYNSGEYLSPRISNFYQQFLARAPGSSDISYYENVWTTNGGPEQVIVDVASSQECFDDQGDSDSNWVTLLYTSILSRTPSQTELNYYVNELQTGTSRSTVVSALANSDEYRADVIQSFFQTFLQRSASSSDVNYYLGLMDNNHYTQLQVQQTIVGGGEYTGNPPTAASGVADPWSGPSGY